MENKIIGKINKLKITRILDNKDAYLDGGEGFKGNILLQRKFVPKNSFIGDFVEVFVYVEKDDIYMATTKKPFAMVGEFARLQVKANTTWGSFLDLGLPKDLLVPISEQQTKMQEETSYLVFIYLDEKSNRIAASSKLDKFLSDEKPRYQEGTEVDLIVYNKTDLGFNVIVDNNFWGLIYKNEIFRRLFAGQRLKGFIKSVRDDNKIDIVLQKSGYKEIDAVSKNILEVIKSYGGSINLSDKSHPKEISAMFGISKKAFKRAIGSLYKKKVIDLTDDGIKII